MPDKNFPELEGIGYGGDYNPEQWDPETWAEDMKFMRQAGVNTVSMGIFAWALLEIEEGDWQFGWMDDVLKLLHENDIKVLLATPTASPPAWLTAKHPEILPVTVDGVTISPGGRQHWRPTSPLYRRYALEAVRRVAERYGNHPAVNGWHVNNELGCHNHFDYSDDAAVAFRMYLKKRYGTIDQLNFAWGTSFWSQRYGSFGQILPPRRAATFPNPTQQLDWRRFSSAALKEYFVAERDLLHEIAPHLPVTTNFMIQTGQKDRDYADWAGEQDFVSNDHYVTDCRDEIGFSASRTSGVAEGRPWFLLEHSTSAVNWQAFNPPKRRGELARDSLIHVARGADAICFFQWRQSRAGAEKYHSSMLPHAGPDSKVFKDVCDLGGILRQLREIKGSVADTAPVGILFDYESWWASESDSHPTTQLDYHRESLAWFSACLDAGLRVDVVPVTADWDIAGYTVVIAPILHIVGSSLRGRLSTYVESGGHLITTYFSGIVDEFDHIHLGGYPGALRDLLGIRIEEFGPLAENEIRQVEDGSEADLWADSVRVVAQEVQILSRWRDTGDPDRSGPAVTRRSVGKGSASYVAGRFGPDALAASGIFDKLLSFTGVKSELPASMVGKVEHTVRTNGSQKWAFFINRTDEPVAFEGVPGRVLVSTNEGTAHEIAPHGVIVVRCL